MRNKANSQRNFERVSPLDEALYHFRLCHACLHLNESDSEVTHCEKCHRLFPTHFQLDRLMPHALRDEDAGDVEDFDDEVEEHGPEFEDETAGVRRQRAPSLQGLSVRW